MSGARNQRTTHPRKQARRQRAAERFYIKQSLEDYVGYLKRKTQEAMALGLSAPLPWRQS